MGDEETKAPDLATDSRASPRFSRQISSKIKAPTVNDRVDLGRTAAVPAAKVDHYKEWAVKLTVPEGVGPGAVLTFSYRGLTGLRSVVPSGATPGNRFVALIRQNVVGDESA